MTARVQDLLEALAARSRERPLPAAVNGVLRLDVEDAGRTEEWYLTIRKGAVTVTSEGGEGGEPDCVLRADAATFAAVLSGETNMMAALLRGAVEAEGRVLLLVVLQRLTPGATVGADVPAAGYARRQS
ncbi:MAG: SCP2 sterol-binding domain-containing protein [Thermoleophilia bacterium]|nr:SCP2 sterol-binding domain-containing protein [Thermoleophilia bacterium]